MDRLAIAPSVHPRSPADSSATAKVLGIVTLTVTAAVTFLQLRRATVGTTAAISPQPPVRSVSAVIPRRLHASAALLATSVLIDSALEHYRGEFENPGMLTPLLTSLATALAGTFGAASRTGRSQIARDGVYASAVAVGAVGSAFHAYNILRRPGGFSWGNLFYSAPFGAPAALSLAGLFGLAGRRVANESSEGKEGGLRLLRLPADRALAALSSFGLAGTSSEVGLLHFRGAFHNPFMWLPVQGVRDVVSLIDRIN